MTQKHNIEEVFDSEVRCSHEYLPDEDGTVYYCGATVKDSRLWVIDGSVYCTNHLNGGSDYEKS
jgi:hypothetical protein